MGPTDAVASFIVETSYQQIPHDAVNIAKRSILDCLGCILAGTEEAAGAIVTRYVKEMGGHPEASVIGGGFKTSAPQAALANGTGNRGMDTGLSAGPTVLPRETRERPKIQKPASLFERMTSGFRHSDDEEEDEAMETAAPRSPAVTTIHPEDIEPPRRQTAEAATGETVELGGLDPADRPVPHAKDDHLEIPSFLRRQAN